MKKLIKRVLIVFVILMIGIFLALIANNLIFGTGFRNLSTDSEKLSPDEIQAISEVFTELKHDGNEVLNGLGDNTIDLIIFNDQYEFLVCNNNAPIDWEFIEQNEILGKNIYRRKSDNPQAFGVFVGDRWVGSMSTQNTINKSMISMIGFIFPPQFFIIDKEHYIGTVIHEMTHALQGNNNSSKLIALEKLHNINSVFYKDNRFNKLFVLEGKYLEQSIDAKTKEDTILGVRSFLQTRNQRRTLCELSKTEIQSEKDFEWLEGLARYSEYYFSRRSDSIIAKNLGKITEKVKVLADDRYYASGMAQAMILDKLFPGWKNEVFEDDFAFEDKLNELFWLQTSQSAP